jgi:hypothetical protein
MNSGAECKTNQHQWQLFLEEVRREWVGRGFDVSSVSDLNELAWFLQRSVDLSESRSRREVEELFHNFEEKIQRAA